MAITYATDQATMSVSQLSLQYDQLGVYMACGLIGGIYWLSPWFLLLGDLTADGYVMASFGSLSTRRRLEGISVNKEPVS